jgi:hypothetical protein
MTNHKTTASYRKSYSQYQHSAWRNEQAVARAIKAMVYAYFVTCARISLSGIRNARRCPVDITLDTTDHLAW